MLYKSTVCITDSKFVFPNNSRVTSQREVQYTNIKLPDESDERRKRQKNERCFLLSLLKPRTKHLPLTEEQVDQQMLSIIDPEHEELSALEFPENPDNLATQVSFSCEEVMRPVEKRMTQFQVSENINSLLFKLEGKMLIPYNFLTSRMRPMKEVMSAIETVNIFWFIEEAFLKAPQKDLFKLDPELLQSKVIEIEKKIFDVQQLFASMCDKLLEMKGHDTRKQKHLLNRLEKLSKVINMSLESSMNQMLIFSASKLVSLLRRLMLGYSFSRDEQHRFDYYLSKRMYRLKQEGHLESQYTPASMQYCFHPSKLFASNHCEMRRILLFLKSLVSSFSMKLRNSKVT